MAPGQNTPNTCSLFSASEQLDEAVASLLTFQPEQRGFAETVCAPVSDQGETGWHGVEEVARLGLGLQRVVALDPGVSA